VIYPNLWSAGTIIEKMIKIMSNCYGMADEPKSRQQLILKGVYLRTKQKAKPMMGQNKTG